MDDIILTRTDMGAIEVLKTHIYTVFSIKDLGKLNYFLGIEAIDINEGKSLQGSFSKSVV